MGTLTIRNVDDVTHTRLRERAARSGRSVEAEVRGILSDAVQAPRRNLLLELRERIGTDADTSVEGMEVAPRTDMGRVTELP